MQIPVAALTTHSKHQRGNVVDSILPRSNMRNLKLQTAGTPRIDRCKWREVITLIQHGRKFLGNWGEKRKPYFSMDLSKATIRFSLHDFLG